MRPARILVAVGLVIAAFAALVIGPASGKKERAALTITKIEPNVLAGKLKTNIDACLVKRTVVVKFKPLSTPRSVARKIKLGTAKTNKKGKWKLKGSFSAGNYTASLKPKTIRARALPPGRREEELEEEEADDADEDEANFARTKRKTRRCTRTRTSSKRAAVTPDDDGSSSGEKIVGPFSGPLFPCDPGFFIDVYIDADAQAPINRMILDNDPPCPPFTTIEDETFEAGVKPPGNTDLQERWKTHKTHRVTISSTASADADPFRIKVTWETP